LTRRAVIEQELKKHNAEQSRVEQRSQHYTT